MRNDSMINDHANMEDMTNADEIELQPYVDKLEIPLKNNKRDKQSWRKTLIVALTKKKKKKQILRCHCPTQNRSHCVILVRSGLWLSPEDIHKYHNLVKLFT